ncbi:hypothetical protein FPE01S_01_05210 [Flavihumibacter petaseus NBRC 106054]|uniref:DUF4175 domain-containing protein n=2 Tax=Flavihumibacter TaxID=1004301 RepID=A0A0E9MUT2_9BACT|nr:hypothetical protein FPE01S_01_05210 [Flavihumibacter petaseus NBRC 106054]
MAMLTGALLSLPVSILLFRLVKLPLWAAVVLVILAVIFSYWLQQGKALKAEDVAVKLDLSFPELEESSGLIIAEPGDHGMLFHLQRNKTTEVLNRLEIDDPWSGTLRRRYWLIAGSILLSVLFFMLPVPARKATSGPAPVNGSRIVTISPAGVSVSVVIEPPGYLKRSKLTQKNWAIRAEQHSKITWNISTTIPVKQFRLVFQDKTVLNLRGTDSSGKNWTATKVLDTPGFYQVAWGDSLSGLYPFEMIADLPPVIHLVNPDGKVELEPGQQPNLNFQALLVDDNGLAAATLHGTIASGTGESVKFRTLDISLGRALAGSRKFEWNANIDLKKWDIRPGDEWYGYITARDAANQESRSDVWVVKLSDTTELMSFDGVMTTMAIKPEFFRSQRQIIIETEQLIKDKPDLSREMFQQKSNDLAAEQKLLRLRYGKFLGEEDETNIGYHEHDEGHESGNPDFGNAQKVLEEVSHQHDKAEDATYFDAATKKQLKATLTEMWNAELKLRIYQPVQALPYEYKALRLLKELQQQSRVYVAKTTVRTTPLDPGKRGTGDQDKIVSTQLDYNYQVADEGAVILSDAMRLINALREGPSTRLEKSEKDQLDKAIAIIGEKAAKEPASWLHDYEVMVSIREALQTGIAPVQPDLGIAAAALTRLSVPVRMPAPAPGMPVNPLIKEYRKILLESQRP